MVSLNDIRNFFRGHIALNEPLGKYTSMRVGGPADYYVEPADKMDVVAILKYFQENNFPYMMLGRGSNLLVSDDGYRGAAMPPPDTLDGTSTSAEGEDDVSRLWVFVGPGVSFTWGTSIAAEIAGDIPVSGCLRLEKVSGSAVGSNFSRSY